MAFTYRFETVLKVRKIREDLALQEFSKRQRHYLSLVNMLRTKSQTRDALRRELIEKMKQGLGSHEVRQYYSYLSHLESDMAKISGHLTTAEQQMNSAREHLIKAKKDSKTIERLREIHEEKYLRESNSKEMCFIDELAIMRHGGQ